MIRSMGPLVGLKLWASERRAGPLPGRPRPDVKNSTPTTTGQSVGQ